jgi:hypothetical protein
MYIAIGLIVISLLVATAEIVTIKGTVSQCLSDFDEIDNEIYQGKTEIAIEKCKDLSKKFENYSNNILYCYYDHNTLDNINQEISALNVYLEHNNTSDYYSTLAKIKRQLKSIKDEELPKIQNIL